MQEQGFKTIELDGQKLYIPTLEQWGQILDKELFLNKKVSLPTLLKEKIDRNSKYVDLINCLGLAFNRVMFYELVKVNGELFRVFVESVICDNCNHQVTISATPGSIDCYFGVNDEDSAMKRGRKTNNQSCPNCKKVYNRRYTIWLK